MDPDFTSLKAVYPELAEEWSPNNNKTPYEVKYDSRERHLWVCKICRCDYLASIEERLTNTKGCLVCKDVKVAAGINDLASVDPQLQEAWNMKDSIVDFYSTATIENAGEKLNRIIEEFDDSSVVERQIKYT